MAVNPPATGLATEAEAALEARLAFLLGRMLIAGGSTFFASYFFSFGVLHIFDDNGMWLPKGVTHPGWFVGIASPVLLVLSGIAYLAGQASLHEKKVFHPYGFLAAVLGLGAVVFYGASIYHLPFTTQSGGYASIFIGLTRVYATVLLCTVVFMTGLALRASRGLYPAGRAAAIDAFGECWGWMIAVGVGTFLLLYVVPFLPVA